MSEKMPLIVSKTMVMFPNNTISFELTGHNALFAVNKAHEEGGRVFFSAFNGEDENGLERVCETGTIVSIKKIFPLIRDKVQVVAHGEGKGIIIRQSTDLGYTEVVVEPVVQEEQEISEEMEALMLAAQKAFDDYYDAGAKILPDMEKAVLRASSPALLCDLICGSLDVDMAEKQSLLEMDDVKEKLNVILELLLVRTRAHKYSEEISVKARRRIENNQKEYYLREQQKVISEELGEAGGIAEEIEGYRKKAREASLPAHALDKLEKEVKKLRNFSSHAQEGAVIRDYIQWLLEVPWQGKSEESKDLKLAEEILDQDHYGLLKVKERIIEFLAVRQNAKDAGAPVLCLAGPPGTGKTSIAKSIAKALNRKYERMSLGGVRDEAEIRGHRRTYVGSMPGRIITLMSRAKVTNPVILLDEIDKISADYKGDPSSALLEVLDGEQNKNFRDHYLEVDYDLSDVFFIATANTTEGIMPALKDRLEIIELSGYTQNEKLHIAESFLIPKQMKKAGIEDGQLSISAGGLMAIIRRYTREAGVRQLERLIGKICAKAVKNKLVDGIETGEIGESNLQDYLGVPKYKEDSLRDNPPGVVTGLAWTTAGGCTLYIEAVAVKGKGQLNLTGNLGDVMKESAKAAIGFIRANGDKLKIPADFYKNKDIFIHIPQGGVPKDGPSAGLAICLAVVSALTGEKVCPTLAMTGEISVTGRALPIGGLKEKLLGAKTFGIKTVIIPVDNGPDLEEIEGEVKEGLNIIQVETMGNVLDIAFGGKEIHDRDSKGGA